MNLSEIKNAKVGQVLWDKGSSASIKGLHLRVYENGRKSFLLYYRSLNGNQRRPKIGDFPETTLADARSRAKILIDKVAIGEDPKEQRNIAKKEMTIQELFELVHKKYWSQERFVKSGRSKAALWSYNHHFKNKFGKLKISEVTRKTIREWHNEHDETPYSANRSLEFLNTMFVYAEKNDLIEIGKNPCKLLDHYKEKKRKRYATPDELKKIAEILEKKSSDQLPQVVYIWILLFSGSRPKFIADATWNDLTTVELDNETYGILSLSGKTSAETGDDEIVVLPPQAMKFLDKLPKTSKTITGIKLPRKLWREVRKEANCLDLRARDLRRTFATLGVSNGVGLDVVSELLNHKSVQTTKIYGKLMNQKRIEAAKKVADAVEKTIWPSAK